VPGRHGTFLVSPRKVPQRRRPGRRVLRCATDSLRFSLETAAAELAAFGRSNSPRRLPRFKLRCSARPTGLCPWLRLCLSLANLGRVGSLLPTDPRGQNLPTLQKHPCPASRSGIASQPCLQANTRAVSSPTKKQRIAVRYRSHRHGRAPAQNHRASAHEIQSQPIRDAAAPSPQPHQGGGATRQLQKPLCYWPAGKATSQYRYGLQPCP
jgi:hypothetical protein